jgi:uncharacterized protein
MNYLYLHGFASGPQSTKAVDLRDRFSQQSIALNIPDLNQGDFFNLTLTRQLQQCEAILAAQPQPWTILGSSLGGLAAAWLGQRNPSVERLVLLAPAFEFLAHWQQQLGADQLEQWQQSGAIEVYHHVEAQSIPLGYAFWRDAGLYNETALDRPIPTLIVHGVMDDVVPVEASQRYVAQRPWCKLIEMQSDHGLTDVLPDIWAATEKFCAMT